MGRLCVGLVLALLSVAGCSDDCKEDRCSDGRALPPVAPTPVVTPPPVPVIHRFEFRVLGDSPVPVEIRFATSQEGTTILTSQLPWTQRVVTADATSFLSLTARLPDDQFLNAPVRLQVQILVNGLVFREASVVSLTPSATVSGLFNAAIGVQGS